MHAFGVDIGGSGVRAAIVDTEAGRLRAAATRFDHGTAFDAEDVVPRLREVLLNVPDDLPVGVGFPGVVKRTTVESAPNLGPTWEGLNISEALDRPVVLLNDADAAATAERHLGAARDEGGTVLTVTIGTGLGTSVHRDGVLVPNLELGLLPHPTRGGVIEAHASGRARRDEGLDLRAWAERFQEALDLYEGWLNPDLIVLAGGITESWEQWSGWLTTRATLRKARFGADAGLIGAAVAAAAQRT
ncbi:MAG: ROK family protein [archaeon]|nr:ROK family protein [archaeon]